MLHFIGVQITENPNKNKNSMWRTEHFLIQPYYSRCVLTNLALRLVGTVAKRFLCQEIVGFATFWYYWFYKI